MVDSRRITMALVSTDHMTHNLSGCFDMIIFVVLVSLPLLITLLT